MENEQKGFLSKIPKYGKAVSYRILFALFFMGLAIASYAIYDGLIKAPAESISDSSDSYCNVVGINLHGMLATYIPTQGSADDPEQYQAQYGDAVGSEDIVSTIRGADQDDTIKAIMMEVDSSGGYPVAGEEIADALKQSTKPTGVVIRQSGLSAAYWASTGATQIFASRNSD